MTGKTEKHIRFLKAKCISLKGQLQKVEAFLTPENLAAMDEAAITVQLEQVEAIHKEFGGVQGSLEQEDNEEIGSHISDEVSAIYIHVKTELLRLLISHRSAGARSSTIFRQSSFEAPQTSFIVAPTKPRLPVLQIPKFSGVYTEWPDFYSMFETVVGNDMDLTKIEKFQHLRSCLSCVALDTIRSLEISEQNYEKAIEILTKRFDNKRLNFQAHVRDIVQLSGVEAGSVDKLRFVSDSVNSHLRALFTMGTKEQIADCLLIHIIGRKLDIATQTRWEEATPVNIIPTWELMAAFLEKRCQMMENVESALVTQTPSKQVGAKMNQNFNSKKRVFVASTNNAKICSSCKSESHMIYNCQQLLSLTPAARFKEVKRLQWCLNCLRRGHIVKNCQSGSCRHCSLKHHTLLHLDGIVQPLAVSSTSRDNLPFIPATSLSTSNSDLPPTSVAAALDNSTTSASASASRSALVASSLFDSEHDSQSNERQNFVFLATAIVFIKNKAGSLIPCRTILDSASQAHFVTSSFAGQLLIKPTKTSISIAGIGQSDFFANKIVDLVLQATTSNFSASISAVVVPTIVDNQPSYTISVSNLHIPANIHLADPLFYKSQRIDLLIGADLFYDCVGQIRLGPQSPILQKTKFGWIVVGSSSCVADQRSCLVVTEQAVVNNDSESSLDHLIQKFWEVENHVDVVTKTTKEELDCEHHFVENHMRLACGSYSVRLPLKANVNSLGDSFQQALHRFKNLERRLQQCAELKAQYSLFLREYLELQHMSPVSCTPPGVKMYFLPHHCVLKAESTTTKLRVVFDGSARTSSGTSLNEICMAGPTIQSNLFDILLRFRSFKIALTGDVCKMYRCVKISHPDNYLQCVLWRERPEDKIQIFKLDTVTYGTKPASFLAIRSMQQLAADEGQSHPIAARIVRRDFYVDDLISGGNSIEEVLQILRDTTELLSKGNFKLRKWCSNSSAVLNEVADADKEKFLKFHDGSDITKALGLVWDPNIDNFLFSFVPFAEFKRITKRVVLSFIARFYDPLGLIGPVIAKAKIFMQFLWKEKLGWDESLPQSLQTSWICMCAEFELVSRYAFPRLVLVSGAKTEIHAFCDASLSAYGVCVYVRSEIDGVVESRLLCSKSRVTPLKALTVPKLELSAALLLAELMHSISHMDIFQGNFHCWCDSTVVLSWLREESSNYNIFVSNRISRIQSLTDQMSWHYVPTEVNPADILSRGATPKELLNSSLWKCGPVYLKQESTEWPAMPSSVIDLPERRKKALLVTSTISDLSLNSKYITSFGKLQRVFAYIYKFGTARTGRTGPLTTKHIQMGTFMLIRMVQKVALSAEYRQLADKQPINSNCHILSLSPFLDEFGLIRVGGRLQNSALDFESRHPIILPKQHPLTDSIIEYFHHRCLYAGPQALLATIRLQYWPIGGRKTVSRVVNRCVRCFRVKPKLLEHIIGRLPAERLQANRAFLITGVDYAGPLFYRSEIRNRPPIKCYISLFVCFSTKAVHLELVSDLSTQSFLGALKRFACTRGKPKTVWSDNVTNFVGAKNELIELKQLFLNQDHIKAVSQQCLEEGIDWKFIPPRSPHFGGLWEASIKIAKLHLLRTVGLSSLTFDELRTLICQISAIMNSRPLCPITENADDLEVLTPAHFLIGAPLTSVVEPDVSLLNIHRLDRWQRVCFMQQLFWKRWSTDYLTLLQERTKWRTTSQNIKVGDIVLLKDENLAPLKWPLARVIDVVKGDDDVVRVAVLRTTNGVVKRAVAKLCLLPSENDAVESASLPTGGTCSGPN